MQRDFARPISPPDVERPPDKKEAALRLLCLTAGVVCMVEGLQELQKGIQTPGSMEGMAPSTGPNSEKLLNFAKLFRSYFRVTIRNIVLPR